MAFLRRPTAQPLTRFIVLMAIVASALFAINGAAQPREPADAEEQAPHGYARLLVITNFENTEVSINDVSYPYEYVYANRQGIIVPAGITFLLKISVSTQQTKHFRLRLEEGETRVIVADIANMGEAPSRAPARASSGEESAEDDAEDEEDADQSGYLGVSSSPRGVVYVDGESTGRRTPARRIELEPGRHRVQIFYESKDEMSETKHVLIRAGTNTNVFFRHRD